MHRKLTLVILVGIISLANSFENSFDLNDPCLISNCQFGTVCVRSLKNERGFLCLSESPIRQSYMNTDRIESFLRKATDLWSQDFDPTDPCLSSPCAFSTICRRTTQQPGFVCDEEMSLNEDISHARQVYRNMEENYRQQVQGHVHNRIMNGDQSTNRMIQLKANRNRTSVAKNPCSENPCNDGYHCVVLENVSEDEDPYDCIKNDSTETLIDQANRNDDILEEVNHSVPEAKVVSGNEKKDTLSVIENKMAARTLQQEIKHNITEKCRKLGATSRIEHPLNKIQFIVCLDNGLFTIFDCPTNLVFNKHWNRCDYTLDTFSSGCESMPCQYGGKCTNLEDFKFKCECRPGYSGVLCELAPDICSPQRCGLNGFCHSLPATSIIPYYCTCFNNRKYGMTCESGNHLEQTVDRNPCLDNTDDNTIFASRIDASIYVHCDSDRMQLKYCMNLDQIAGDLDKCEWLELSSRKISVRNHQLRSYFENLKKKK